jgi:hypothetical protein
MYNSCVFVTTAQPNAYNNKADENKKNGSSQNSLSTSNATTKRTVIKIGGMHCVRMRNCNSRVCFGFTWYK